MTKKNNGIYPKCRADHFICKRWNTIYSGVEIKGYSIKYINRQSNCLAADAPAKIKVKNSFLIKIVKMQAEFLVFFLLAICFGIFYRHLVSSLIIF